MTYYANYTTLDALKTQYLDITVDSGGNKITVDDALLAALIRDTSRQIERSAQRTFAPRVETRKFDMPKSSQQALEFDDDLLVLTSIVNGDGATLNPITDYILYPYNQRVKFKALLIPVSAVTWQPSATQDVYGALNVSGVWGYAKDGDWIASGGALTAAITSTTATTFTATKNKILEGWLIQIDTEMLYILTVASGSTEDQITVARGVNGSTASTHLVSAPVSYWQADYDIEMICRQAAAAAYRIRANPTGDTVVIDGTSFATPKDISVFIYNRLGALGYRRVEFG
jgi:hypothetical protein